MATNLQSQTDSLTAEQVALLDRLNNYRMYDYQEKSIFENSDLERPIPKVILNRFLEILANPNPPFTEAEINSWKEGEVEFYLKNTKERSERTAQRIANKEGKEYEEVLDSLITQGIARMEEYAIEAMQKEYTEVSTVFVLSACFNKIYEAIPILEKAIQDTINYNPEKCLYALARLHVEPYHSEFIEQQLNRETYDKYVTFRYSDLKVINSQESIFAIAEILAWEDLGTKLRHAHDTKRRYVKVEFACNLYDYILNKDFRALFDKYVSSPYSAIVDRCDNMDLEGAEEIRQWLIDNKGKYILKED